MSLNNHYLGELIVYLKKNLRKGYTRESLRWALVNQGHSKLEVDKAFKRADEELAKDAPILKSKPLIKREVYDSSNKPVMTSSVRGKGSFWKRFFG